MKFKINAKYDEKEILIKETPEDVPLRYGNTIS